MTLGTQIPCLHCNEGTVVVEIWRRQVNSIHCSNNNCLWIFETIPEHPPIPEEKITVAA